MRILKLYIDNFKGVANPTVIDFEKDISILKGPNGFGKTTIFDAIELCVTGEIYRTKVYENVTEDRTDYSDAFYRNKKNKDMVLNLLVEGFDNKRSTIVKILPATSTGRVNETANTKRYKASEWGIIDTYLVSENEFGLMGEGTVLSDKLTQADIEIALLGSNGGSLVDLYRLFAYLQQAENTFYLKKTERNRKAELDHLFRTDAEADVLKKLNDQSIILNKWVALLDEKIKYLGEIKEGNQDIEYLRLFEHEEYKYDALHPYSNVQIEQIDETHSQYKASVYEIEKFLNSFDPSVYAKNKIKKDIFSLAKSDQFLDYIILNKLVGDDNYAKLRQLLNINKYVESKSFLRYFILQNFLSESSISSYEDATRYYETYVKYLKDNERPITVEAKLKHICTWNNGLSKLDHEVAKKYLDELDRFSKNLDNTQSTVSDLVEIRASLSDAFNKIPSGHMDSSSCECPFCGFDWKNLTELTKAIDKKTDKFNRSIQAQTKSLNELKKKIEEDFLVEFDKSISTYIDENLKKYNFLTLLNAIRASANYDSFAKYAALINDLAKEVVTVIWSEVKTTDELDSDTQRLNLLIKPYISLDQQVVARITALVGYKFDDSVQFLVKRKVDMGQSWLLDTIGNVDQLNSRVDSLRDLLMSEAQSIEIDTEKLGGNLTYMFKEYFQEDPKKLPLASSKIKAKLSYLETEYQNNRRKAYRILTERMKKLKKIKDLTKETKTAYESELKKYKREMIEKIKLPFYIYTAKILQNYQQGMGVFISSPNTNSDSIRFVTESESNHDIVHHLSSGQLAVVSIAFTLAINKVYGDTSLNILAIDDPVYELDALNVFSFVELLRRSFASNYQIILSTHDDDSAKYMKYRFEKIEKDKVSLIDVQDIFFTSRLN